MSLALIVCAAKEHFTAMILDVEGAEALLDWTQLPPSISKLIIELHPEMLGHAKAYDVLNKILNCGFHVVAQRASVFGLSRRTTSSPIMVEANNSPFQTTESIGCSFSH